MNYPVVIHKDIDSDYGVTVPDLPGCFSAGSTMDDALANAVEAIATHVEGLLLDGESIPGPNEIETHQGNPDYNDGIWAVVSVDLSRVSGSARRINVTIPERILSRVDDYVKETGDSRSSLMAAALLEYVSQRPERELA
jgi:predicted RNase H-like HicB family nuclease